MNKSLKAFLVVAVLLLGGILAFLVASRIVSRDARDAAALYEQQTGRTPESPREKELARFLLTTSRRLKGGSFGELCPSDFHDYWVLGAGIAASLDTLERVFQSEGLCDEVFRLGDRVARKTDSVVSLGRKQGSRVESDSMYMVGRSLRRWLDNGKSIYRFQRLGGVLRENGDVVRKVSKLPTFKVFYDVYPFKEKNGRVSVCSGIDSVVVSANSDTVTIHCRTVFYKN